MKYFIVLFKGKRR